MTAEPRVRDQGRFYSALLAPVADVYGPFDQATLVAIVGFWAGGPVNIRTIGREQGAGFITYVTCELAINELQVQSQSGHYEIFVTCDDQRWARAILTKIGQMTLDAEFGHIHTLDISPWVGEDATIQGILFERFSVTQFEDASYAVLRLHGLTCEELESALDSGPEPMLQKKIRDPFPHTTVGQHQLSEN